MIESGGEQRAEDTTGQLATPGISRRKSHASLTKRRLIVVFCILACVAGFLLYKGLTSAVVYFKTADQALADRSSLGNSTFQIEGLVVPGSVRKTGPSSLDFAISSNKVTVRVENQGVPPSLFQSDIPVVLLGHFIGATDVFSSDQILIKHSNQYIAAHPNRVRAPNGAVH